MIVDLKPYPAMKDSGVPWLGEVPEHWEVRRIKTLFREKEERSGNASGVLLSLTRAKGIVPQAEASSRIASAEDLSKYKVCRPGDLVMNRMQAWSGMFALSTCAGVVSPDYSVFGAIEKSDVEFFEHLFKTPSVVDQFAKRSKGIGSGFNRLYTPDFGAVPVAIPPHPEQEAIVRFLDHAVRRIRRYIRAKQKLIKLLEEQKQTIIHRAVTRGLDPNVRLKPSGVEWLGEVPKHWTVMALRLRYTQCLGKMLDSKRITGISSLPYLRNTDVQWDRINVVDLPIMDIAPEEYGRYTVRRGDLLVCEGGEVGRCAIWSGELETCGFQKALHRLRPRQSERDVPRFMYYVLRVAAKGNAFNDGHQSTIAHLTGDKLRAYRFPFPSAQEQADIVEYLDHSVLVVEDVIVSAQNEISLLREYRTRLIADVVTGKLDVRVAAANLPDESDEPEVLDNSDTLAEGDEDTADGDLGAASEETEA